MLGTLVRAPKSSGHKRANYQLLSPESGDIRICIQLGSSFAPHRPPDLNFQPVPCLTSPPGTKICAVSRRTKHGCGHYEVTKKGRKHDCGSQYCTLSTAHNPNCRDCQCEKFFGPDIKETITVTTPDYCTHCEYWFKGPGSIPRR